MATGEQYVDAYNGLAAGLSMRRQAAGQGALAPKAAGAPVSQADLQALRNMVLGLLGTYVEGEPDRSQDNPFAPVTMSGIGDGEHFTKVPAQYTSQNQAIFSNSFVDVPLLWIHFTELRDAITKLRTLHRTGFIENSSERRTAGDPQAGTAAEAMAEALRQWQEDPFYQYNVQPPHWYSYVYRIAGDRYQASCTSRQSTGRIDGLWLGPPLQVLLSGTRTLWRHYPEYPTYHWRSWIAKYGIDADGRWSELTAIHIGNGNYTTGVIGNKDDQPAFPPVPGEDGQAYAAGFDLIGNPEFVLDYAFPPMAISDPGKGDDSNDDGIVATGCECGSCPPTADLAWQEMARCPRITWPLGLSSAADGTLRVKAYLADHTVGGRKQQMYSLRTRPVLDVSGTEPDGNQWRFVAIQRPLGAEVVFPMFGASGGHPDNGRQYRLAEIADPAGPFLDLSFENGVVHRFGDPGGGTRLVQVRRQAEGQPEESLDGNGVSGWPSLDTEEDGGGRIVCVRSAILDAFPEYDGDDMVIHVRYLDKAGNAVAEIDRSQAAAGNGHATRLERRDNAGNLIAVCEIIDDPDTRRTTVRDLDPANLETVLRETLRTEGLNEFTGNRLVVALVSDGVTGYSSATEIGQFPWGEEVVAETLAYGLGPDQERRSEYSYYGDSADGPNYARLKLSSAPDGSWTRYTYDTAGRTLTVATPFGDSLSDAEDDACRLVAYDYTGREDTDFRPVKVEESVLGTLVSRTTYAEDANTATVTRHNLQDSSTLVTTSEAYPPGHANVGRLRKVTRPDGTISVYTYANDGACLLTTVESGIGTGYTVTDGTRSVTRTGPCGATLRSQSWDILSSLLLSDTVNTVDSLGRTIQTDYLDGTHTETVHGPFGPTSRTDREGVVTTTAYDLLGRVESTTTLGITTAYTYDVHGNTVATVRTGTDNSTVTTTSAYNAAGELVSTTDALDHTTSYAETFDGPHRIYTTTYPDGKTSIQTYYLDGSLMSTSGTAVHGVTYGYGIEGGQQFTITYPTDRDTEWTKSYTDSLGRNYKTAYGDNNTFSLTSYDAAGRPWKQVSPGGIVTLTAYNTKGEVVATAVDMNRDDTIDYAGPDRVTASANTVVAAHGTTVRRSTSSIYPNANADPVVAAIGESSVDGLQSWQTDINSNTTHSQTVYPDPADGSRTVTVTNPDASTVTQNYTNGFLTSTVHSVLGTTSYTYDAHGRLHSETRTIDGVPRTTTYTYDANDQVLTITDPASRVTTYTYDEMGRRTQVDLPGGRTVHYEYHDTGELKKTWGSDTYPVAYTYDSAGRMKTLKTWQDFTGNPNAPAVTTWNYDPVRGFLASKTYHDGQGPSYTYYADGRLHTRTWARGVTTTYTYDDGGMLSGVDYFDATPDITYDVRDRMGRPTMITDGTGTHSLAYRPDGQTISASIPQVSGHSLGYGYDALGRRSSVSLNVGASAVWRTDYTYDGMSRLATASGNADRLIGTATYARVPGSNLLSSTVFNNGTANVLTVSRSYDSLDRLVSISSAASAPLREFSYTYNDRDQRTRCTLADGSYWVYQYDTLGQVTSGIKYDENDVAIPGCGFGYDFDDIGNRKSSTITSTSTGTIESIYDPNTLNQYESRTVPGIIPVIGTANADTVVKIHRKALGDGPAAFIVPDRTGNIFHKNIAVDNSSGPVTEEIDVYCHKHLPGPPAQEIAAKASRTVTVPKSPEEFAYDPDGNLTSDGLWAYSWDAENRLVSVESVSSVSNKTRLEFTYDFQSRRTSKKVYSWDGNDWQLDKTEKFVYDGWNLVATFNAANTLQQSYLWGEDLSGSLQGAGGVGGLLAIANSAETYLPVYDGNGNIMAYIDAADGTTAATFEYDPFGRTIATTGTAPCAFRFSTKPLDVETGLYYYGYRYYSPEVGRWLGRDPITENGFLLSSGLRLKGKILELQYIISRNSPMQYWDYLGLYVAFRQEGSTQIDSTIRSTNIRDPRVTHLPLMGTINLQYWIDADDLGTFSTADITNMETQYFTGRHISLAASTGTAGMSSAAFLGGGFGAKANLSPAYTSPTSPSLSYGWWQYTHGTPSKGAGEDYYFDRMQNTLDLPGRSVGGVLGGGWEQEYDTFFYMYDNDPRSHCYYPLYWIRWSVSADLMTAGLTSRIKPIVEINIKDKSTDMGTIMGRVEWSEFISIHPTPTSP